MGNIYRARGCHHISDSSNLAHLGYSVKIIRGQAGRTDRICRPLRHMDQLRNDGHEIGGFCCNGSLCGSTRGIRRKRIGVITVQQSWRPQKIPKSEVTVRLALSWAQLIGVICLKLLDRQMCLKTDCLFSVMSRLISWKRNADTLITFSMISFCPHERIQDTSETR